MSTSPTDLAALIGFGCEAVLYGSYCILFIISWIVLGQNRRSPNLSSPVVFANCLLFFCCTAHFALEFNHYYTTLESNGFSAETPGLMGADFLISFTDLVGDLVLVYRCWMLWGQNYYVVILPLLSAFGGFACIMEVLHLVIVTDPTAPAPPAAIVPLGLAGYILPLATNIIVTTLIVYRIWMSSRIVKESPVVIGQGASYRAMMLIIESGALYLFIQFVFVVLFSMQHPAQGIVAVIATQIYGIAPTLIIIRVGLGVSSEHTTKAMTSTRIDWIARRGGDTGTSGTQFTVENSMAETDMDIRMKDFDLAHMKGHDEIEIAEVDMAPTSNYESASPV
ncbi:hypothetical protein DFJ58DRAFT_894365 [Suillus subalutaceus]|uniref:uncharacterized protein n=1 Tax=Suillus subalutaceus TaxID=48586 RepID=UPI001B866B83|nr:uncharacterized protein DFJ58DRAFT_894365 [Suillus subalutaceus]KAG1844823.1 hypothetical protein DFJ58DRAFT_894365 [Suillus subalutaceus]